jgi:transposase
MGKQLYWPRDAEWQRLEPLLPRGRRGAHRVDEWRPDVTVFGSAWHERLTNPGII